MLTDEILYYKKGFKYQVAKRCSFQLVNIRPERHIFAHWFSLSKSGLLTVEDGYAWDGASGPTIDTKSSMRASLIHDIGYQIMRMDLMPSTARHAWDTELYSWCRRDKMWSVRAMVWREALRKFATAYLPEHRKKTLLAP
jgi:hypothetical protein